MPTDRACPECNGNGYFGGNGPIVDSQCKPCNGTGISEDYRFKPDDPRVWRTIFNNMQERRERQGD